MDNKRTLFKAYYQIEEEVEGLPFSYGYWGETCRPLVWLTYEDGNIEVYPNQDKACSAYYNMLRRILKDITQTDTIDESPW